jgi:SAM-dependent methyltransferase
MGLYSLLTNNILVNTVLIEIGLDSKMGLAAKQWKAFRYNEKKTFQENAGFSHTHEVQPAIDKVKTDLLNTLHEFVPKNSTVLDFGCGPGIYMQLLSKDYQTVGIDVSEAMISQAHTLLPENRFYCGDFLATNFEERFTAIYSISVLEYVPVSRIEQFFKKCFDTLEPGGIIFIQYPHAIRLKDLFYPDRNYINYSPKRIDKIAKKYFSVVKHEQSFDGKAVCRYDKNPYPTASKTFKNGYVLIARKPK